MSGEPEDHGRSVTLHHGAVKILGRQFSDERGESYEVFDDHIFSKYLKSFTLAQENIIHTRESGTLRGLHYQTQPFGQAKLVNVLQGKAQFFWASFYRESDSILYLHSIILDAGRDILYTPESCAHGFLALENDTVFSLKVSRPVNIEARRTISFISNRIHVNFAIPPRLDL